MMQETSLDVYFDIKPRIGHMQGVVFETIIELGAPTDLEIARHLHFKDPNKVKPRRRELVKCGLVKQCPKRKCFVSGRKVLTWSRI